MVAHISVIMRLRLQSKTKDPISRTGFKVQNHCSRVWYLCSYSPVQFVLLHLCACLCVCPIDSCLLTVTTKQLI